MTNYLRALSYLSSLMRRSSWDKARLKRFQDKKLREIFAYAYANSSFYYRRFKEAGLGPQDIRTTEDLRRVPLVRKSDLIGNMSEVVSKEFSQDELKLQRTSGSTGRPLYVYLTGRENEFRKAKHLRAQVALGQKPWDKWVTITSPLHFAETSRLQKLAHFFSITPISVFDDVGIQLSEISAAKPDVIDGYSNSILLLAKEIGKQGLTPVSLKFLVSGAEWLDSTSREFVEKVFSVPFYDQYASVEFERIAWQCKEKRDYHLDADSVLAEFVDENGDEVARGEKGEIVCTSLFNYAMPFIRYALDDIGVRSKDDECACGRVFPLMKVLEGRRTSLLTLPSGKVLAPFAFMLSVWTFKDYGSIDLFRVVQTKKDLIIFKVKLKENVVDENSIARALEEHVRKSLNLTPQEVDIRVEPVAEIPLGKNGKFQIVTSQLSVINS